MEQGFALSRTTHESVYSPHSMAWRHYVVTLSSVERTDDPLAKIEGRSSGHGS